MVLRVEAHREGHLDVVEGEGSEICICRNFFVRAKRCVAFLVVALIKAIYPLQDNVH